MYALIKPFLFALDPERSHAVSMRALQYLYQLKLSSLLAKPIIHPHKVMGLTFQNAVGLAAGLDKNADYVDALSALGFGFIEVGTVTPKPQEGNPQPRLFRLIEQKALINRMGFNNKGMDYVATRLEKIKYRGVLGINLGKNKDTPLEEAVSDYLLGFKRLWPWASYFTINISSPNTQGLRHLQRGEFLQQLLIALKDEQAHVQNHHHHYIPLVIKIAPDLTNEELHEIAYLLLKMKIDGVIATNTTIQRPGVQSSIHAQEQGGLSGAPLTQMSTHLIKELHAILKNQIPIIASGGIMDEASAQEKIAAGALLLQVYTGLIYEGPGIISKLVKLIN